MEPDLEPAEIQLVPKRRFAPWLAALALAAAGALGYLSFEQRDELKLAHHDLERLREERKTLADALDLHRAASTDLDVKLTSCEDELTHEKSATAETSERVAVYEAELSACRSSVKDLEAETAEAQARLEEFKELTGKFQKMISSGKLDVMWRRGKMVVKLPEAVLFPSGSAELSQEGRGTIAEVAGILAQMRSRRFTVSGHTDNVPLGKDDAFKSNWELSTARAVAVLELLIARGVAPRNLSASGFGEYDPVASNATRTGRARNRRIEIILEPQLSRELARADLLAR